MTATAEVASANPGSPRRRRTVRVVLVLVVLALAAMWVYVLFIGRESNPNRLADDSWAARAEQVCAGAAAQIEALPPARAFADIKPKEEALRQRADVGDDATAILRRQLTALRALPAPTGPHDPVLLAAWLTDWDTYLSDRDAHVADWRAGKDDAFAEALAESGGPISDRMDDLATDNGMPSCVVPGDFG